MTDSSASVAQNRLTAEHFLGTENRWRRFGKPVPAGGSTHPDGTPDYGLFGPGSVTWEVLLHPATIVFESIGQSIMQVIYKPIAAGVRDCDPLFRKGRAGTVTFFDAFERFQRNSGMHAPMWLGDTKTAKTMAEHLARVHKRVAGDIIDVGEPSLGGYAATDRRETMWASLTEMHPILRMYEAFAFNGLKSPRRLPPEVRDQFIAEVAAYVRLVGANEEEIPTTMAELAGLYEKYSDLFGHTETMDLFPDTRENSKAVVGAAMKKNFHISQMRAAIPLIVQFRWLKFPVLGALSGKARRAAGLSPFKSRLAVLARYLVLPLFWLLQQAPFEKYFMRLMWGPDGVMLIESARRLHKQAIEDRKRLNREAGYGYLAAKSSV